MVNGEVVKELGARADFAKDKIEVDGRNISQKGPTVYYLLNKPKHCISSVTDPLKRQVVVDLIKTKTRIFPVGRLDYDAEGVIILTNDGELTNKLIHPNFSIPKKYLVKVKDVPRPPRSRGSKRASTSRTGRRCRKGATHSGDERKLLDRATVTEAGTGW